MLDNSFVAGSPVLPDDDVCAGPAQDVPERARSGVSVAKPCPKVQERHARRENVI